MFKLSQQIPPSRLRKGFLVIGIALLILSFFFFYWASRVDYDYHSVKNYSVTAQDFLSYRYTNSYNFSLPAEGVEQETVWEYPLHSVIMNQDDALLVDFEGGTSLGPSHIVLYSRFNSVAQSGGARFFDDDVFVTKCNLKLLMAMLKSP
jgi:hypothetical protein